MSTLPLEEVIPDAWAYPAPSNPNLLIMIACIYPKDRIGGPPTSAYEKGRWR